MAVTAESSTLRALRAIEGRTILRAVDLRDGAGIIKLVFQDDPALYIGGLEHEGAVAWLENEGSARRV